MIKRVFKLLGMLLFIAALIIPLKPMPVHAHTTINTEAQLQAMTTDVAGDYILGNNITITGPFTPVGNATNPFTGTFNGNGFSIINLQVSGIDYVGLFGNTGGLTPSVANVTLVNPIIQATGWGVGPLIGWAAGNINISRCVVIGGNVTGGDYTGGLIGGNEGPISQCAVVDTIVGGRAFSGGLTGDATGSISESFCSNVTMIGTTNAVGLLTSHSFGTANITDCYAIGNVTGTSWTGGIVGSTSSLLIGRSYSSSRVNSAFSGGLTADGLASTSGSSSYWNSDIGPATDDSVGSVSRTTAQLQTQSTFAGWDFSTVWGINASYNGGMPYLLWYWSAPPGNCLIQNLATSYISTSSALVISVVLSDGGEPCQITFGWDNSTHAADFSAYPNQSTLGSNYTTGELPWYQITSLNAGETYYWNTKIENSTGENYGVEMIFTTASSLSAPDVNYLFLHPEATIVHLDWTAGAGSQKTLVKAKLGSYPSSTSDGTTVHFDAGTSANHTGLTPGTTWYYTLWGWDNTTGYSSDNASAMITTLAGVGSGNVVVSAPSTPSGWFQSPNITSQVGTPWYPIITEMADSWQMPQGTFWLGCAFGLSLLIGMLVWKVSNSMVYGAVGVSLGVILGWAVGIIPLFYIIMYAIIVISVMVVRERL